MEPEQVSGKALSTRSVLGGVFFWLGFCIAAVLVRGVRWDENYEFAQIMLGRMPYPAGHPLVQYVCGVFSGQTALAAACAAAGAGPAWLCGLRNVAYLAATVLPVFLFASRLGGRARWGHLAAALAIEGILLEFDGGYPMGVWPELYSNGHIGEGYVLCALYALLAGHRRTAAFLIGLAPAVHIGQVPLLFLVAGGAVFVYMRKSPDVFLRTVFPWFAAGVLVCVVLFAGARLYKPESVAGGAYAVSGDAMAIWRGFVEHVDPHRRLPHGNVHPALLGAMALGVLAWWRCRTGDRGRLVLGMAAYVFGVAAVVWGTMLIQKATWPATPPILLQWLPYRMSNHAAPLLLALGVGMLGRSGAVGGIVPLALLFAALRPVLGWMVGPELWRAYLFSGECVLFGLYGAALYAVLGGTVRRALLVSGAAAVLLAFAHQFGAVCLFGGAVSAALLSRAVVARPARVLQHAAFIAAVVAISLLPALSNQGRHREHLPRSGFERAAASAMRDAGGGLVLAAPETYALQARLEQPVFIDAATGSLLTYLPALAPTIQKMHEDAYGLRFDRPGQPKAWYEIWSERDTAAWASLARHYGIAFLITPPGVSPHLPESALLLADGDSRLWDLRGLKP